MKKLFGIVPIFLPSQGGGNLSGKDGLALLIMCAVSCLPGFFVWIKKGKRDMFDSPVWIAFSVIGLGTVALFAVIIMGTLFISSLL